MISACFLLKQCCGTVTIFLRFRFRLLNSSSSGSGSYFIKIMVPVPAPYLDHKKQIKKIGIFFAILHSKLFYKVPVPVPVPQVKKLWSLRLRFLRLRFRFRFHNTVLKDSYVPSHTGVLLSVC